MKRYKNAPESQIYILLLTHRRQSSVGRADGSALSGDGALINRTLLLAEIKLVLAVRSHGGRRSSVLFHVLQDLTLSFLHKAINKMSV